MGTLNVMKALAESSLIFSTETLVAMYKAIKLPILNYATPIWFNQVSSTHLNKLEVIQNKALRNATGCNQKATVSTLTAESRVLSLRAHLELCSQQFYASALHPTHFFVSQIVPKQKALNIVKIISKMI